jgi:hypothetical protein
MSNLFPVFGAGGQEGNLVDSTQQGSAVRSFAGAAQPLPIVHNGQEQEAIDRNWRMIIQVRNPALLRAMDLRERRQREHAAWQALVCEKQALVYAKTTAWQRVSPDQPALARERREELAAAEDSLREAREETLCALEELQAAEQRVANLTGVA